MNNLRKIAAGSLAAVLAFSMAACGSSNASSDGTGESTGKAVTVNEKSAKATPSPTSAPWKTSRRPPRKRAR